MSYSYHATGVNRTDARGGLQKHQEGRENEEEAEQVAASTQSKIDPTQSHLNKPLIRTSEHIFSDIKRKADLISERRKAAGRRPMYKSANIAIVGTIQLSNETLERMGWDRDKKASEQTPEAMELVTAAYTRLTDSMRQQPERYGVIKSATLHFDESTPHVDLIIDAVDVERDRAARHILNGPEGKPAGKGQAMREMQDHLADFAGFSPEAVANYDLKRGDSDRVKRDKAKQLRVEERKLAEQKAAQEADAAAMSKYLTREIIPKIKSMDSKEKTLEERESALIEREKVLTERIEEYNEMVKAYNQAVADFGENVVAGVVKDYLAGRGENVINDHNLKIAVQQTIMRQHSQPSRGQSPQQQQGQQSQQSGPSV